MSLIRAGSRRFRPTRKGGEGGQVLVAVIVLVAIVSLVGVSFARWVTNDLDNSGSVVDASQARALAMAGVDDARFRIDQQSSPGTFCVGPSPCTVQSVPGAPGVRYTATYSSTSSAFTVLSEGVSQGRKYAVQETVTKSLGDFYYGIFGASSVTVKGNNKSGDPSETDPSGNLMNGPSPVASDGSVSCNGGSTTGTEQDIYGSGSGCANTVTFPATAYVPQLPVSSCPAPSVTVPPTPCMPPSPQACPSGGTFAGILQPGVYDCTGSISFSGTVSVNYGSSMNGGKVQIFVFPVSGVPTTIDLSTATVNQYDNVAGTCNGQGSYQCGDPTALQVYSAAPVGSGSTISTGPDFDGLLYAPGMDLTANGHLQWTGALVVNNFTMHGGPNLAFEYDSRIGSEGLRYAMTEQNFSQVPPSLF